MRRSLGPLVLLAILALPAIVAPVVGWQPQPSTPEEFQDVDFASYDYSSSLDLADTASEPAVRLLYGEPGLQRDTAVANGFSLTVMDRLYLQTDSDAEPVDGAVTTDERVYAMLAR